MNASRALISLTTFTIISLLVALGLWDVLSDSQPGSDNETYSAAFVNASYIRPGEEVRVAGVHVGQVQQVAVAGDGNAIITFSVDSSVPVQTNTRAAIKYKNLIGDRYLALAPGPGPAEALVAGATLPVAQTTPALDLDELFNGFRPLFQALTPTDVNRLSQVILQVFQGEGSSVDTLLGSIGSLTSSIADQNTVIDSLIDNLNTVLGTVDARSDELSDLVVKLQQTVGGLSKDRQVVGDSINNVNSLADQVGDLVPDIRSPLKADIDRAGVLSDGVTQHSDLVSYYLGQVPAVYSTFQRSGAYGDFVSGLLCSVRVKFTGPDGKDTYTPFVGRGVQRCERLPGGN